MPFTPDAAKPPLLDQIVSIRKAQALWTLLAATGGPAGLAVLGPVGLVFTGVAALCLYALEVNKIDVDRILNDPPRPEFDVSVRARRRRFDPESMQSPIERAAAEFVAGLLDLSAYFEAAVRADERAQGAMKAGARAEVGARSFEGHRATERAASAGEHVAVTASSLAAAVSSDPAFATLESLTRSRSLSELPRGDVYIRGLFPPQALEYVGRTRLVIAGLEPTVRITDADAAAFLSDPSKAVRTRGVTLGGATQVGTRVLRNSYRDALHADREREFGRSPLRRQEQDLSIRVAIPREPSSERLTEAARRWLANFVDMYAGIDLGEGDPVHAVRENARALLATGPTERDPFIIAEQIVAALPGDSRAAGLGEAWRDELRGLGSLDQRAE